MQFTGVVGSGKVTPKGYGVSIAAGIDSGLSLDDLALVTGELVNITIEPIQTAFEFGVPEDRQVN